MVMHRQNPPPPLQLNIHPPTPFRGNSSSTITPTTAFNQNDENLEYKALGEEMEDSKTPEMKNAPSIRRGSADSAVLRSPLMGSLVTAIELPCTPPCQSGPFNNPLASLAMEADRPSMNRRDPNINPLSRSREGNSGAGAGTGAGAGSGGGPRPWLMRRQSSLSSVVQYNDERNGWSDEEEETISQERKAKRGKATSTENDIWSTAEEEELNRTLDVYLAHAACTASPFSGPLLPSNLTHVIARAIVSGHGVRGNASKSATTSLISNDTEMDVQKSNLVEEDEELRGRWRHGIKATRAKLLSLVKERQPTLVVEQATPKQPPTSSSSGGLERAIDNDPDATPKRRKFSSATNAVYRPPEIGHTQSAEGFLHPFLPPPPPIGLGVGGGGSGMVRQGSMDFLPIGRDIGSVAKLGSRLQHYTTESNDFRPVPCSVGSGSGGQLRDAYQGGLGGVGNGAGRATSGLGFNLDSSSASLPSIPSFSAASGTATTLMPTSTSMTSRSLSCSLPGPSVSPIPFPLSTNTLSTTVLSTTSRSSSGLGPTSKSMDRIPLQRPARPIRTFSLSSILGSPSQTESTSSYEQMVQPIDVVMTTCGTEPVGSLAPSSMTDGTLSATNDSMSSSYGSGLPPRSKRTLPSETPPSKNDTGRAMPISTQINPVLAPSSSITTRRPRAPMMARVGSDMTGYGFYAEQRNERRQQQPQQRSYAFVEEQARNGADSGVDRPRGTIDFQGYNMTGFPSANEGVNSCESRFKTQTEHLHQQPSRMQQPTTEASSGTAPATSTAAGLGERRVGHGLRLGVLPERPRRPGQGEGLGSAFHSPALHGFGFFEGPGPDFDRMDSQEEGLMRSREDQTSAFPSEQTEEGDNDISNTRSSTGKPDSHAPVVGLTLMSPSSASSRYLPSPPITCEKKMKKIKVSHDYHESRSTKVGEDGVEVDDEETEFEKGDTTLRSNHFSMAQLSVSPTSSSSSSSSTRSSSSTLSSSLSPRLPITPLFEEEQQGQGDGGRGANSNGSRWLSVANLSDGVNEGDTGEGGETRKEKMKNRTGEGTTRMTRSRSTTPSNGTCEKLVRLSLDATTT